MVLTDAMDAEEKEESRQYTQPCLPPSVRWRSDIHGNRPFLLVEHSPLLVIYKDGGCRRHR